MTRTESVLVVVLLVVVAWGLMALGWRHRARRQLDVAAPAPVPADVAQRAAAEGVEATYVSTTSAADWLDRVVAHGLGTRSAARLLATDAGLAVVRDGAPDVFVPTADLRDVRRESVRAGKAVPGAGLLVWDWDLGGTVVSTAVRLRHDAERDALEATIRSLLDHAPREAS
ncbi:hypothetical protein GCM10027446_25130 [Angustibacter peucedani]